MPRLPVGGVCEVRQDRRIVTRLASRRSFRAEGTARAPALGSMFRTAGGFTAELLVLLGQIRIGYWWTAGLVQRSFFW